MLANLAILSPWLEREELARCSWRKPLDISRGQGEGTMKIQRTHVEMASRD